MSNQHADGTDGTDQTHAGGTSTTRIALSWALVGVPLLYALYETLLVTMPLVSGG